MPPLSEFPPGNKVRNLCLQSKMSAWTARLRHAFQQQRCRAHAREPGSASSSVALPSALHKLEPTQISSEPARARPQLHRPQGYERVRCKDVVSGGRWKRAAHGWWHIFASIPSPRFMLVRHPQLDQLFDAVGLARVCTGVGRHLRLEQLVDSVGLAWVEKGLMAWGGVCVVPLTA